jgi:histidinol-phosphate aminotransferase
MGKFDELLPEHIRRLPGYAPGKPLKLAERESGVPCIKLASNENPLGPSPLAVAAIHAAAPFVHLYPDVDASELRDMIASRHRISKESTLVTGGTTPLLDIIARCLLAPGLNAVTSHQSFLVYAIATQASGSTLTQVATRKYGYDLDGIREAIDERTRIVFIANPNNPTGSMLEPKSIEQFLDRLPAHVVVVLDEAYHEFAQFFAELRGVEYSRSLDYVRDGRNVVVLRTFSKAQGLAGLRLGYGFGPPELVSVFARMRNTFSISALAEAAGIAALEDAKHIVRTLENNAKGVACLTKGLEGMGLRVAPTWANFLFVEIGEHAARVVARMQEMGVIVRPLGGAWGAPHAIRISIGTPEQNRRCLEVLKHALEPAGALQG